MQFKCNNSSIQTIQFSISTQLSSIWPIDRTLSDSTTPVQSGPWSKGNDEVLCIPQSSNTTGAQPSDCLVSYQGHLLEESYTFAKMHHHHHHVVPLARISLTFSRHFFLSFIASGRSSGLHPVSSHSCCMYVWVGRPAFAWSYAGVHRSISLMSSSLLLQQRPACLVRLTCIVFVMGGRWPYSWCRVGCCRQDLFNIARNILV